MGLWVAIRDAVRWISPVLPALLQGASGPRTTPIWKDKTRGLSLQQHQELQFAKKQQQKNPNPLF